MSIVYRANLNMDSGTIPTAIHVGQYDDDFSIVFTPYSTNGVFTIEEGTTAEIRGTKRDGNGYSAAATIDSTVTPKTVTVEGATQMTAIAGKNPFEIVFEKNGKVVSSANFNLVVEHAAMDAETVASESVIKEIGESVNAWLDEHGAGAGLTESIKVALLQIAEKVAYIDEDGQDYYDALHDALYPPVGLDSITAVYTQSGTVYDTDSLDAITSDLVVTANWSDGTTTTLTSSEYTLSGTLTEGTSTITVVYGGQSTTFSVEVIHSDVPSGYTAYDYLTHNLATFGQAKAYAIHTNAQLKTDYTIEAKMYLPSGLGSQVSMTNILGTRNGNSGTKEFGLFYRYQDGRLGYWYDETDSITDNIKMSKDTPYTVKVKPVGDSETYPNNATISLNGTDYNTGSTSTGKTFDPWFGIFGYAISETSTTTNDVLYEGLQLGEILVTDSDDTVVYDFIPAKDDSDKYGFYERVNGIFYYNATYAETGFIGGYWE